ncbi:MAG TPA: glycoside hydrolase family 30 beta sandwich domain-containing protein [Thermoanaerobaculia bacterium]
MRMRVFALCALVAAAATAQIVVDAQRTVRTVPAGFFGINAAIWDDQFVSAATKDVLTKMSVRMLRFPGGSASDEYHFLANRSEGSTFPWPVDFNTFAGTATDLGVDVMITVNYGTGTAEEAASWVEYSNVNHRRGFRYWEIGNEVYGSWETDNRTRPHDPKTYAEAVAAYMMAMKRFDPSIRIGIPVVPSEDAFANYDEEVVANPRTGIDRRGWTPLVLSRLRELESLPDFVSYHRYEYDHNDEDDARLLTAAGTWKSDIATLRQILNDYAGNAGRTIEILCTENNSVRSRPGKQTVNLVNAFYLADSLGQALQTEVSRVLWWDLRNGKEFNNNNSNGLYGWRTYGDYGVVSPANERYPTSYAAELFGSFAKPGDVVVEATSTSASLSAYAVKRTDGSVAVLLINKSSDQATDATIQFKGFTPSLEAISLLSYGIPNDIASTGITRSTIPALVVHAGPYSGNVVIASPAPAPAPAPPPSRRRSVVHR